ncbi:MAG: pantetheine-phosphate adenylyltransferase [Planctomycetes bacterium]|nr:pantetheine-phosphate adenylyltransferase [Planctomycetota bacterium]
MRKAIYPGTFDPPHRGHVDLIERGRRLVDELIVAVAINRDKRALFTAEERVALIERSLRSTDGVRIIPFDGLVVELMAAEGADFILRGIRTFTDFEAELAMAYTNRELAGNHHAETLFVLPRLEYSHYSSRRVKEVASFGGAVDHFLPDAIRDDVAARLPRR